MESDSDNLKDIGSNVDLSPLVGCMFENDAAGVALAIARGEDPNGEFAGCTLLQLAVYHGQPEILSALIAGGARVPADALSTLGEMDITDFKIDPIALEPRYAKVAEILLAHGATPHVLAYTGEPLITTFPAQYYPNIHRVLTRAIESRTKWREVATSSETSPLGSPGDPLRQLESKEAFVIMEGDDGGIIILTCPVRLVRCSYQTLWQLAHDLSKVVHCDDMDTRLIYESLPIGSEVPGGTPGAIVTDTMWLHPELTEKGLQPEIEKVINGTKRRISWSQRF